MALASIQTSFWQAREYLAPLLKDSKFKESGRLTPDEFVAAGDYLVYKFPTWQWESGDSTKRRDFLPAEKQYLIQRNVPCLRRVSQLAYGPHGGDDDTEEIMSFALAGAEEDKDEEGEDWVATHISHSTEATTTKPSIGDIPDDPHPSSSINTLSNSLSATGLSDEGEMPDMDQIPDIDDDDEDGMGGGGGVVEEEDDAALDLTKKEAGGVEGEGMDNLIQVRTYDCSITYDKYYQTPRMWLLGYDEQKRPLPPQTALSDVSADHAQKTVTIEPFPHSSLSMASVHPCKHSSVMKRFIERMDAKYKESSSSDPSSTSTSTTTKRSWLGKVKKLKPSSTSTSNSSGGAGVDDDEVVKNEGLRVDQYLVVFLKFMSSIVPTIEVDATNAV